MTDKVSTLGSVDTALQWSANMTWKGTKPIVHRVEATYQKGVKATVEELEQYQKRSTTKGQLQKGNSCSCPYKIN